MPDRLPLPWRRLRPVVAVLRFTGVIGAVGRFLRGLTHDALGASLERAFSIPRVATVALAVNSPGGSAVQSALLHRHIRALAAEKKVPVVAFCEDVAASGGYWLACAGDEIFAHECSIVGSIGVISASFGFAQAIERVGIERRLHTAGARKSMLDPFRPEDPEDVARLKAIQGDIHAAFMAAVRERRHGKLRGEESELFSGEVWTGARAKALGLVDGLGDLRTVMRERFGERVRFVQVGAERTWLRRLLRPPRAADPGDWAAALVDELAERAAWSRFGL
jgi:serine protease SohB